LPDKTFEYIKQKSAIFGTVGRPLIRIRIFSEKKKIWIPIYDVLLDSGADVSILPRFLGDMIVNDITKGKQIELRGICPYSKLIAYIHNLRIIIVGKELSLPVAIADSDDVPVIFGRVKGMDMFNITLNNGKETVFN